MWIGANQTKNGGNSMTKFKGKGVYGAIAIGNAAGQGARLCMLSIDEYQRSARLAGRIEYLELAADPAFQDVFVDELEFPGEED